MYFTENSSLRKLNRSLCTQLMSALKCQTAQLQQKTKHPSSLCNELSGRLKKKNYIFQDNIFRIFGNFNQVYPCLEKVSLKFQNEWEPQIYLKTRIKMN